MLRKVGLKMKQFLLLGGYSPQTCTVLHTSVLITIIVLENGNLLHSPHTKQLDYPFLSFS